MTTRTSRTITIDAPIDEVWSFIADPIERASAISVVDRFERRDAEGRRVTWHVRLPIPFVSSTVPVETEELDREPPTFVRFVGRSSVFTVEGSHELEALEGGRTRLTSRFDVDGRVPGVETFFKRNLDDELDNLERALRARVTP
ncbi:MAG: SRPBCC family protein [Halobacteriales archaeon]